MLENRSLDNVLGWLYENDNPKNIIPANSSIEFNGLQTERYSNPTNPQDPNSQRIPVGKVITGNQKVPSVDPHEDFLNVQKQISNNMQGFFSNFKDCGSSNSAEIMDCYTPESLPVLNGLAKEFAVSDAYFSSIPTQTNCNRAFSLTGNSIGYWSESNKEIGARVNNEWEKGIHDFGDPFEFTEKTIFNVLSDNGYSSQDDWSIFYNQTWPGVSPYNGNYCFTQDLLWPNIKLKKYSSHFKTFREFQIEARNGQLPKFSYLEPTWYEEKYGIGHNGSDYHPPGNVGCGEKFLFDLYNTLKSSPKWGNTLLIINFDEHGGTYDHVEPPIAKTPWENEKDGTIEPHNKECNFDFKLFGVRVPLILVSPLIKKQTVFRSSTNIPFDHTSVIATILNHFNVPKHNWNLGSRTANAPTFENVINLASPRNDIKPIPNPINSNCIADEESYPNDLQIMIIKRMIRRHIKENNLPKKDFYELFNKLFNEIEQMRMKDLNILIHDFFLKLNKFKQ